VAGVHQPRGLKRRRVTEAQRLEKRPVAEVAGVRQPRGSKRRRVTEAQRLEKRLVSEAAASRDTNDTLVEAEVNEGDEGEEDSTDAEAEFEKTTAMVTKDRMVPAVIITWLLAWT
jgi:hypothetical protein